ncbi:hypothetical protein FH603_3918 [Spirosoma sp. LMG 31447]|uniref:Uncharacterized protein n=1 Tax=Spirosoma utsteinense TaxID=2585773 RepID=A0ABR6WA04_9BACT|nr:hypothetical protein [Spirosoma utsteinense]
MVELTNALLIRLHKIQQADVTFLKAGDYPLQPFELFPKPAIDRLCHALDLANFLHGRHHLVAYLHHLLLLEVPVRFQETGMTRCVSLLANTRSMMQASC